MREVEDCEGHVGLSDLQEVGEGILIKIGGSIQRRRCCQKAEMVIAFGKKTIEQNFVESVRALNGFSDSLG